MSTKIQKKSNSQTEKVEKMKEIAELPKEVSPEEKEYILSNLNKFPYRGALTHIANKRNVSRNAIFTSLRKHNNKAYLAMIKEFGDNNYSNIRNVS